MMNSDPVCILLASTWTGGEKLLFRYPNSVKNAESRDVLAILSNHYYALKPSLTPSYSVCNESGLSSIKNGVLVGFEDPVLANLLLTVNTHICTHKYEIKINDVLFVGYSNKLCKKKTLEKQESLSIYFNVVFALRSNVDPYFIDVYQDLSQQISHAIIHEESRVGYLSVEKQAILELHELHNGEPNELHDRVSVESSIGRFLKKVFEDVTNKGSVDTYLNKWIRVSHCINPRLSRNMTSYYNNNNINNNNKNNNNNNNNQSMINNSNNNINNN
ncbi:hypothetical protein HELRODRAFT_190138, partial [Helobdella robusta]|uniref:Uncharacterized protein n=1 Tax=Helobdella robusta TaxID=6412 RepID=T1FRQ3_HELRO